MRVGSLFAGIGGIDLAFERAGFEIAWSVENDLQCSSVLEQRFPNTARYADVRTVHASTFCDREFCARCLPSVDVLAGGFPCQDLSVAGRREGLAGKRSGLFREFVRLADQLAPTWLLIENVPGLLSSNEGEDMGAVVGALAELGYGYAWRVLDAQHFGVPQRRRRLFLVGCARGRGDRASEVLFEPESCQGHPRTRSAEGTRVAGCVTGSTFGSGGADDNDLRANHVVHTLTGEGHDASEDGTGRGTPIIVVQNQRHEVREMPLVGALSAYPGATQQPYVLNARQDPITSEESLPIDANRPTHVLFQQQGTNVGPSGTLRAGNGHVTGGVPFTSTLRRLTPRECERLQGFPDDWTLVQHRRKPMSDSARYRMCGNAVAVPVAEWIARRMLIA